MQSRARIFGYSIHQLLIVFPLGLLVSAFLFDLVHVITGSTRFADASFWMIAGGVVTGVVAGLIGLVDWLAIPSGTRAKRIGALHGLGNIAVVSWFSSSWLLRYDTPSLPPAGAIVLSGMAVVMAAVTGWLGGELVDLELDHDRTHAWATR